MLHSHHPKYGYFDDPLGKGVERAGTTRHLQSQPIDQACSVESRREALGPNKHVRDYQSNEPDVDVDVG
jgi:hypothetical protein